jgi:hypothetical protein
MPRASDSSEYDPSEDAEGGVDQLGLAPACELLANRLLPAIAVPHTN